MTFLLAANLFFLGTAFLFYVLFAGADFGAGILELFRGNRYREDQRKLIASAIAPVWEANHIWIVLVLVILFMGFPTLYTLMSVHLFIPMIALLVGIVLRGCAFTFRYYDSGPEYHALYSRVFELSSLWSAVFLGVLGGALILGRIDPQAADFYPAYIAPWLNAFCAALGVFTALLFAFLASVFLVGEAKSPELRRSFLERAIVSHFFLILAGAVVFLTAEWEGRPLFREFVGHPVSLTAFVIAGLLWWPFWRALRVAKSGKTILVRAIGVIIVALILIGWYAIQYPVAIRLVTGEEITFLETAAPDATLRALFGALVVGSLLIFPSLFFLLRVFKAETFHRSVR